MRAAFVKTLEDLAEKNKDITLLVGDLGFSVFENYIKKFPKQYLNCGVAEQNMTGVAAGMALEGKIPVLYSIAPFVSMRNFEQVRNDICYQNLNVKIVSVGSGYSYGIYGHTHYGLEDMGILRTIPRLTILSPGDPIEAEFATIAMFKTYGSFYMRFGRSGDKVIHKKPFEFKIGKGIVISKGKDIALLACGTMLPVAFETAEILKEKYSVGIISMHTIKPIDEVLVKSLSVETKGIFTLEEHSVIGGLGSAVAEVLAENKSKVVFKRFGAPDQFSKVTGRQKYMQEQHGLSPKIIADEIVKEMR
jgi:transketolase